MIAITNGWRPGSLLIVPTGVHHVHAKARVGTVLASLSQTLTAEYARSTAPRNRPHAVERRPYGWKVLGR